MTGTNAIEQQMLQGVRQGEQSSHSRIDSTEEDDDYNDDSGRDERPDGGLLMEHPSLGPRSGYNTGVKGVRNDAKRHADVQRAIRADQVRATNERMEGQALGKNRTWEEDEVDRKREAEQGIKPGQKGANENQERVEEDNDDDDLKEIRQRRLDTLKSQVSSNEARRRKMAGGNEELRSGGSLDQFGHLREVGADHYASAIDMEDKSIYVVVHIYVKYVHACAQLTSALSLLARMHSHIKFIQVRAGHIGFGNGGKDITDEVAGDEEAEEVVPTLLVYQGGELLANLVRVDLEEEWREGQERDVRDILRSHGLPL